MKKTILSLVTILALGLTGCGTGGEDAPKVAMEVKYADGSTFGVTRAEDEQVNGGYTVYDVGTGEQIGFIQLDGSVNDINGIELGVCQGALDEQGNFTAECTVPTSNPTTHIDEPTTPSGDGNNNADNHTGGNSGNSGNTPPIIDPTGGGGGTNGDTSGAGGSGSETSGTGAGN